MKGNSPFISPLRDSLHSYLFFSFCLLALQLFCKPSELGKIALIMLACFVSGVVIEFTQPYVGGNTSIVDIYYNLVGIICASVMFVALRKPLKRKLSATVFAVIWLSTCLAMPLYGAFVLTQRDQAAPILLSFDQSWERQLWRPGSSLVSLSRAPQAWQANQSLSAKITFTNANYSGFHLKHPLSDWSPYTALTFEIFSKQKETLNLVLRIHDKTHNQAYDDRYNQRFRVEPGLNTYRISLAQIAQAPSQRTLDMQNIDGLGIFMVAPKGLPSIYLDNLGLD